MEGWVRNGIVEVYLRRRREVAQEMTEVMLVVELTQIYATCGKLADGI